LEFTKGSEGIGPAVDLLNKLSNDDNEKLYHDLFLSFSGVLLACVVTLKESSGEGQTMKMNEFGELILLAVVKGNSMNPKSCCFVDKLSTAAAV